MAIEPVDGYDAVLVRGAPRYRLERKMIAEAVVPENIKMELLKRLADEEAERNTPKAVESADKEQTSEGTEFEATEEEAIAAAEELTAADFDGTAEPAAPSDFEMKLIAEIENLNEQLANSTGLKNATIFDLANEMYDRFGVYTVFINKVPRDNDIHPFSGEVMTRYEVGLAYQKHNQVVAQGKLTKDFGGQFAEVEASREASVTHRKEMQANAQMTPQDHEKENTFAYRTSVNGQNKRSTVTKTRPNDPISEDATVEPDLRGKTIRPEW